MQPSPLSQMEMPYYNSRLLSQWGYDSPHQTSGPEPDPSSEIRQRLKKTRHGFSADLANMSDADRDRILTGQHSGSNDNGAAGSLTLDGLNLYKNVKMVYGKQGIREFDFSWVANIK